MTASMPFYLIQPGARDQYRQATVVGIHETVEAAYADMDRYAEAMAHDTAPELRLARTCASRWNRRVPCRQVGYRQSANRATGHGLS